MACATVAVSSVSAARSESPVKVVTVLDGDTVDIENGERVRMLGIDAPEGKRTYRDKKHGVRRITPAQPFFLEARNLLRQLVHRKRVHLEMGNPAVGFYGRTLAYLHLPDGTDVQAQLLARGYAMVTAYPPNLRHLRDYARVEQQACLAKLGVWGHPHFALQNIRAGVPLRTGRGRVRGAVTGVEMSNTDIRITLNHRLTLLIHRGAWRKFWGGQVAENWLGAALIARGKIKQVTRREPVRYTMRIRHPFMLRTRECQAW